MLTLHLTFLIIHCVFSLLLSLLATNHSTRRYRKVKFREMWLANSLTILLIFGGSVAFLQFVKKDENLIISSYVRKLVMDLPNRDPGSHDVAMLLVNKQRSLKQEISDLFDEIRSAIPESSTVLLPSLKKPVIGRQQGVASFIVIISDTSDAVSPILLTLSFFEVGKYFCFSLSSEFC